MNNDQFSLKLSFVTPEGSTEEHESTHPSIEDALEEGNELAFSSVGFSLEEWKKFAVDGELYMFIYIPNEADRESRYRMTITEII